jgi:phosphoribosyl 1,2-cyclic phosphodiesterase
MNYITILGSGDTLGTPLNHNGDSFWSKPGIKRSRFGLLLELNGTKILVDTNPDLKWQSLEFNFNLKDIDYVLITHTHSDHLNGLGEFYYKHNKPVNVYHLQDKMTIHNLEYFKYLEKDGIVKFTSFTNFFPIKFPTGIKVTPIELNHGFPCSGFVIEYKQYKIGIVTDTNLKLMKQTIELLANCDFLFVDSMTEDLKQIEKIYLTCNLKCPNLKNDWYHLTIDEAKKLQNITNSRKAYTVHMSPFMATHPDLITKYQTNDFVIGYDGLKIIID